MTKIDPLQLAGAKAKGKRPWFLDDPDTEKLMNIVLVLAQEMSVMRERMDTIETLLEQDGAVTKAAIEAFEPTKAQADARGLWTQEFLARVFRILQQDREALQKIDEESSEQVGEEFAKT